ncbi:dienelactone hydrolase endo-1,3,1,4-beta-D-glucanase [Pholiota conissans]|uniref:Dienelactone hydrolase endo-1,3,1,4-beta-D-glucanase n=1 Tax=Pholiota conissans TaxID=109636 RepID=A0A9P5Z2T7_9AGAR|nr:dienelactone hydrolase endo-1,3,1,4-beta-D-glucanase [Pholiota conissans]
MATCPRCAEGAVLLGEPTGSIVPEFQGAYLAPAPGLGGEPSKFAVFLLTDAFGLPLKNSKIIADEIAKRLGCDVWIPDYFDGRPMIPLSKMSMVPGERAGVKVTTWEWIRFIFMVMLPQIPVFIGNRPSVALRRLKDFTVLVKEKKKYEKIGTVGYCFGGTMSAMIGMTGLVDSIVVAHPGKLTVEQVSAIKAPASFVFAEDDLFFTAPFRDRTEAVFAARKGKEDFLEYECKTYKATAHGFACRPNLDLPEVKKAYEDAFEQTIAWFKKTIVS